MDYIVNDILETEFNFPQTLKTGDRLIFNYVKSPIPINLQPSEYLVEVFGAGSSGQGGYAKGKLKLLKPITLYAYIGAEGSRGTTWNGSGVGHNSSCYGGGSTDLRLINGIWNELESLRSRIIVAGGGGGFGGSGSGGVGGGLSGGNGSTSGYGTEGKGGTQTSGGSGGTGGKFGIGGSRTGTGGGGGGGGYYGGGGTSADMSSYDDSGAGGGSGFISGHEGCNAIDKFGNHTNQPNHYSGIIFTETEMESGMNNDDGKIIITAIGGFSNIYDISFSNTNVWEYNNTDVYLRFKAVIFNYIDGQQIEREGKYKVFVNEQQISGDEFIPNSTINVVIPQTILLYQYNRVDIQIFDIQEAIQQIYEYVLVKENRDTFIFLRTFDFKEDYITDENVEVIYEKGLALNGMGVGEVFVNIPTEGKSKIKNIGISGYRNQESIIPFLTSNNQDGYEVSASSMWDSNYPAWKAFDGKNETDKDCWASSSATIPQWIKIKLPIGKTVNSYSITSRAASYNNPLKSWRFEGSYDGEEWVVLDEQKDVPMWNYNETREYEVTQNIGNYLYYKIYITSKYGSGNWIEIGELQLYNSIDIQEEITIDNEMIYTNDLGAGKLYESRILTEYRDIQQIGVSI